MKLKTVSGKSLGAVAPLVLGGVGGAMLGRGLTAVISKPAGKTATQAELDKKMYVQGAMAISGFVGYAAIDGSDTAAQAVKGAALGIAIDNTIAVVGTLVGKSTTVTTKLAADTTINRFAKASLGLACPGNDNYSYTPAPLQRPRHRRRGMGNPENIYRSEALTFEQMIEQKKDLLAA
jgi:hypothetical protein